MEPNTMLHSNILINSILQDVSEPYSNWKIGITSSGRMNSEGVAAVLHTGYNKEEVMEAFAYFTQRGMRGLHRIGLDPINIYVFNVNGVKVPGPIPKYDEDGRVIKKNVEFA
jgi:hypothetical protein